MCSQVGNTSLFCIPVAQQSPLKLFSASSGTFLKFLSGVRNNTHLSSCYKEMQEIKKCKKWTILQAACSNNYEPIENEKSIMGGIFLHWYLQLICNWWELPSFVILNPISWVRYLWLLYLMSLLIALLLWAINALAKSFCKLNPKINAMASYPKAWWVETKFFRLLASFESLDRWKPESVALID